MTSTPKRTMPASANIATEGNVAERNAPRWLGALVKSGLLALVVAGVVLLLRDLDWPELSALLAGADRWLLGLALALMALRPVVWAARWRLAAARHDRAPGRRWASAAVMAALAVDHLTPTARVLGALLRTRWLVRGGHASGGRALGAILYEQLSHDVVMALATIAGLCGLTMLLGHWWLGIGLAVLAVAFIVCIWLVVQYQGERIAGALVRRLEASMARGRRRVAGLLGHGRDAVESLRLLAPDRTLGLRCMALGCVILLLDVVALLAVFEALGYHIGFVAAAITMALGRTAGVIAGTPGGLGATEAAIAGCLMSLGVPAPEAWGSALLLRAVQLCAVFAMGLPALAAFELGRPPRP